MDVIWNLPVSRGRTADGGYKPLLHHFAWTNPHPGKTIATLDFESDLAEGNFPFLIALTAEP
ncbi:MAG: hypothetical protein FJ404_10545 [Verrucomicrobia bacterium]|nr:hypothetical protein [Verrucomicrobiota bacterium]